MGALEQVRSVAQPWTWPLWVCTALVGIVGGGTVFLVASWGYGGLISILAGLFAATLVPVSRFERWAERRRNQECGG